MGISMRDNWLVVNEHPDLHFLTVFLVEEASWHLPMGAETWRLKSHGFIARAHRCHKRSIREAKGVWLRERVLFAKLLTPSQWIRHCQDVSRSSNLWSVRFWQMVWPTRACLLPWGKQLMVWGTNRRMRSLFERYTAPRHHLLGFLEWCSMIHNAILESIRGKAFCCVEMSQVF